MWSQFNFFTQVGPTYGRKTMTRRKYMYIYVYACSEVGWTAANFTEQDTDLDLHALSLNDQVVDVHAVNNPQSQDL